MLLQRVITALVLVTLLLAALMSRSAWPFPLLTLALIAAAAWEWARLNQAGAGVALGFGAVVALGGMAALGGSWSAHAPATLWWLAVVLWLAGGSAALRSGPAAWPQLPRSMRWGLGIIALGSAWLAVANARVIGINFLLSVLCLVWMADVAAYFGGRAFGRRKLAPTISPGKSWAGVWAGMAGVLVLAVAWIWLDGRYAFDSASLFSRLWAGLGAAGTVSALLALCGLSVVGDLVESLVKRAAGAKDSSRLLPGHGGVLDRVDALLPVLPAALALMTVTVV
jgi:phosphatidate cytidylyltransferase